MRLFKPFEKLTKRKRLLIGLGWLVFILGMWGLYSAGDTTLFPTPKQVWTGLSELYAEGLAVHIASSLWLCARAVFISVMVSLIIVYASPIPILKPLGVAISKFRYLPLTGIAFYITMLINEGRQIQVWILVVFMSTYLITSLLSMLKDIKEEEFDHARALGCSRFEMLWEVVIKGRFDYVIEIIRQNLAIGWMMLVTVESIMAAAGGLGFLIKNSDKFGNHGRIIALQLVILLIGLLMDWTLTKIRKLLFRYSKF